MKPLVTVIALAAMTFTVRAAEPAEALPSPLTVFPGSTYLGGSSETLPGSSLKVPPLNKPLIRSGRHGTIRYFNGPAFSWPFGGGWVGLDLNDDGVIDFRLTGDGATTASIPANTWSSFTLQGTGSNQFLITSNFVTVHPFSTLVSDGNVGDGTFFPGSSWSGISNEVNLTTFYSNPNQFWTGSLGEWGIGYIGVRVQGGDGLHYGWIRVRLPTTGPMGLNSGQPAVLDWAYEKRPNTPIRAGAVSSARGVKEFMLWFRNPDSTLHFDDHDHISYGDAFLIGNTLRYEMHLTGTFSNATFFSDSVNARPFQRMFASAQLDSPRINIHLPCEWQMDSNGVASPVNCDDELTVFFGDIKLNGLQLELLRRGKLQIDVGNGAVIGNFVKNATLEEMVIMIEAERQKSLDDNPSLFPPTEITP